MPLLKWVTLDQQLHGLATDLIIDRSIAARLGLTVNQIDNTLFDAFGERQVSTIYAAQNQYHVVMEVAPKFRQYPETLDQIYTGRALRELCPSDYNPFHSAFGRGRRGAGADHYRDGFQHCAVDRSYFADRDCPTGEISSG